MQECKQNAQDCARRLVLRPADRGGPEAAREVGNAGAPAQEVPNRALPGASFARAFRRALDRQMDERFAALNPADGRVVAPRMRPHGVLWRFHPSDPSATGVAGRAAGAAVASDLPADLHGALA